jgi:rubrerythrin
LRYDNLSKTLKKNSVFVEKKEIYWYCLNCGALIKSKIAPKTCPICQHPQAYFVRKNITIG